MDCQIDNFTLSSKRYYSFNTSIMKKNMGSLDKTLRILAAIAIAILYYAGMLSGAAALILGALAIVFVITSFLSFCPLYLPLGINTCKKKS